MERDTSGGTTNVRAIWRDEYVVPAVVGPSLDGQGKRDGDHFVRLVEHVLRWSLQRARANR